jgi:hypothetical protein
MFTVLQVLFEGFSLLEILVSELVGLLELLVPFVSLGILPVVVPVGDCKEPVFLLKGLLELPSLFLKLLLQILNVLIDLRAILGCLIALSAGGFVAGILEDIALSRMTSAFAASLSFLAFWYREEAFFRLSSRVMIFLSCSYLSPATLRVTTRTEIN